MTKLEIDDKEKALILKSLRYYGKDIDKIFTNSDEYIALVRLLHKLYPQKPRFD